MPKDNIDKALAVAGTLVPVSIFAYALIKKKPKSPQEALKSAFANPFVTALTLDLIISSLAFNRQAAKDIQAKKAKGPLWLYIVTNWFLGLSSGYTLFINRQK